MAIRIDFVHVYAFHDILLMLLLIVTFKIVTYLLLLSLTHMNKKPYIDSIFYALLLVTKWCFVVGSNAYGGASLIAAK